MKMYNKSVFVDFNKDPTKVHTPVSSLNYEIKDINIWNHVHRMYLIGENSAQYPWIIAKDFPNDALLRDDRNKLINFI
jgi:hypothetical protein